MTRAYERIKVTRDGVAETIMLSNPARRNAIGPRMANELLWALEDARADAGVRVIVLTGDGEAFCSGGDFAEMRAPPDGRSPDAELPHKGDFADLMLALCNSDKPIVAKVNGHALGGGLGIVAASALAIASTEVVFGTPEVGVGLFPMIIMAVLARHVPRRRLLEMMLLGETFGAGEAARLGLVNRAVARERLDDEVKAITDALAAKSGSTLRLGLRAFAAQDDLDLEEALPLLRGRLAECLATEDAREGLTAFIEKRPPRWRH
jgi:enoyl-CoA hydratase/carnithine racemase